MLCEQKCLSLRPYINTLVEMEKKKRRGNGLDQKGVVLKRVVDDLMVSPRMQLAVMLYDKDLSFMEALLVELGMECLRVGKSCTIKRYVHSSGLGKEEMAPFLRQLTTFEGFHIHWNMSKEEAQLYLDRYKPRLSDEEKEMLFEKIKKRFGLE